jgi:hypothetical protein
LAGRFSLGRSLSGTEASQRAAREQKKILLSLQQVARLPAFSFSELSYCRVIFFSRIDLTARSFYALLAL